MRHNTDCLIVGGGAIGLSIAWELLRRGLRCAIVDQAAVGRGCSWAGAGILPPARLDTALDPIDQLRGLSHQLHPIWSDQLRQATGIDNGYRLCGGIYLASSPGEAASLAGQASYWSEYGIAAAPNSIDELLAREPAICEAALRSSMRSAWWVPDEAQIRPPNHLQALLEGCRNRGCTILEKVTIKNLDMGLAAAWEVECGDNLISAAHLVLACGAWASRFQDPLGRTDDVFPVRGQAILFRATPGLLNSVINEGHRYLVPRDDGVVYVGSNEEEVGLVEGTTPAVIESLRTWATKWVPALEDAEVLKTISGLRPGSFDGFPHIGRSPKHANLYFATGHYRSGLHLSCATAVVIADLITDEPPKLETLQLTSAR